MITPAFPAGGGEASKKLSGKNSGAFCKGGSELGDAYDVLGGAGQDFEVLAEPSEGAELGEGALDDPALRQDGEPVHDPLGDVQGPAHMRGATGKPACSAFHCAIGNKASLSLIMPCHLRVWID